MLPAPQPPRSGASSSCLSDERHRELEQRCSLIYHHLDTKGVANELAHDAAEIITYKPLPWSASDQALVRRAFERLIDGLEGQSCAG